MITHSALREAIGPVGELMRDAALRERWSWELDLDLGQAGVPGRLLLAYALSSNAGGVVLFASTNEATIRSNVALVDGHEFSAEQVGRFAALVRDALSPAGSPQQDRAPPSAAEPDRGACAAGAGERRNRVDHGGTPDRGGNRDAETSRGRRAGPAALGSQTLAVRQSATR